MLSIILTGHGGFASGMEKAMKQILGEQSQFIAITHRRGTMEHADVLYGVTMQEEGVSKILTLEVSEIENKLGMKNI